MSYNAQLSILVVRIHKNTMKYCEHIEYSQSVLKHNRNKKGFKLKLREIKSISHQREGTIRIIRDQTTSSQGGVL